MRRHVRSCCIATTYLMAAGACASPATTTTAGVPTAPSAPSAPERVTGARDGRLEGRLDGRDRIARIALTGKVTAAGVSATSRWQIDELGGRQMLVRGTGREPWRIEHKGGLLRVTGENGDATPWRQGPFVARVHEATGFVQYDNRRYRGELWFTPTDSGIQVVNRLAVEDYLRGVVPIELGTRLPSDRAALEAQAIAARSYSYARVPANPAETPRSGWHMTAGVSHQLYAGVDVEHFVVNAAIDATAGLVLRFGGLIVDAPYSSSCGGQTAAPREAWSTLRDEPYLASVSDTNPSTGRPFCDLSPRNHWTHAVDAAGLSDVVRRALLSAGARAPQPGRVRAIRVAERTPSGRVGALVLTTERGEVRIPANQLRAAFRDARGAILSSTYFSVDRESRTGGHLHGVSLRGVGNGHGVGMCQWGAIGRSRSGQDARAILRHFYPGTVVGFAD